MASHGGKAGIHLPGLARTDAVDGGPHIIEDAALGDAAQHPERLSQRVEQHLVGLQQIGPNGQHPAMRELGVRHLQLGPLTCD